MNALKIFTATFFVSAALTFNLPTVYCGGDFSAGEAPSSGNIPNAGTITPIKTPENIGNSNENSNNENADNENADNSDGFTQDENAFDVSSNEGNNNNNSNNDNHIKPPENVVTLPNAKDNAPNENLNDGEEDFIEENFSEVPKDTGVIGDVNSDGELNAVDLVILQKYLKGNVFEINENAADIDGNGKISLFDVHALLNLIKAERKGTGDINNDGKVNIYDVQTLTAYLANTNTPINSGNADLNGDGKISTDDLKVLKKIIAALQE